MGTTNGCAADSVAATYYDSQDADQFYEQVWGGEDIHIGLYATPDEAIATALADTSAGVRQAAVEAAGARVAQHREGLMKACGDVDPDVRAWAERFIRDEDRGVGGG